MYYDDEARRFNFVSGVVLGSLVGVALGLLARPWRRPGRGRALRRLPVRG